MQQKKELVVKGDEFSLIVGKLYNMGIDEIMCRYALARPLGFFHLVHKSVHR